MSDTQNITILGKIPGYNSGTNNKSFGKVLLRDITYIDLFPATYTLNLRDAAKNATVYHGTKSRYDDEVNAYTEYEKNLEKYKKDKAKYNADLKKHNVTSTLKKPTPPKIVKKPPKTAPPKTTSDFKNTSSIYIYKSGQEADSTIKIFKNVKKQMASYLKKQYSKKKTLNINTMIDNWVDDEAIRIMAANDSTFTETMANNYGSNTNVDGSTAHNKLNENETARGLLGGSSILGKMQQMSYGSALEMLTKVGSTNSFMDIITGKILGVQFATPNVWTTSNYSSTLSVFLKLASPSGDDIGLLKYITLPIMTMMAAGSPITLNGLTYGMPLIWDVRAYGITRYKVGAIMAMTISRGSYETVFNYNKQPMLVDIRLTIAPLINDFAVEYKPTKDDGILNEVSKLAKTVNADNIAKELDGAKATVDKAVKTTSGFLKGLSKVLGEITEVFKNTIANVGKDSIYDTSHLGVQSASDEIEGLMGLDMDVHHLRHKMAKVSSLDNTPQPGFHNSYTFKI